jgi:hypothetical protein
VLLAGDADSARVLEGCVHGFKFDVNISDTTHRYRVLTSSSATVFFAGGYANLVCFDVASVSSVDFYLVCQLWSTDALVQVSFA